MIERVSISLRFARKAGLAPRRDGVTTSPMLTDWAARQLAALHGWDHTSVIVKAVWLSLLYWVFAVVFGRLTTLFLIWSAELELVAVPIRTPSDCSVHIAFALCFLVPD